MNIDFRDGLPGDEQPEVQTVFIVKFALGDDSAELFITDPGFANISIGTLRGEKLIEMLSRSCTAALTQSTEETSKKAKALLVEMGWERPF